jgi:hypothetical protein
VRTAVSLTEASFRIVDLDAGSADLLRLRLLLQLDALRTTLAEISELEDILKATAEVADRWLAEADRRGVAYGELMRQLLDENDERLNHVK